MDTKAFADQLKALINEMALVLCYVAVAIIGVMVLVGVLVYLFKRENFGKFVKYALGIAVGFALSVIVVMMYLTFKRSTVKGEFTDELNNLVFYPILSTLIVAVAGILAMLICSLFNKKAVKYAGIATAVLTLGGFVAIMVQLDKYFKLVQEWYPNTNLVGLIVSGVVFIVLIGVAYALGDKRKVSDTRSIVYGAVAIALAFALSYIKFYRMPNGGSITLASVLPLLLYSCMFGTRRGTIVCLIYGTLQAVQSPGNIIHPMQFLLDFTLAYGIIGVSGIFMEKGVFKNKILCFLLGSVVAMVLRYVCHVCSGVFAFADYADLDTYSTALVYSMAYNATVFVDIAISIGAGCMLLASPSFRAQMQRSSDINVVDAKEEQPLQNADDEDDVLVENEQVQTASESVQSVQESGEDNPQE